MRVMLVAGSFPPCQCGVGDYIARLAQALAQMDDVHVAVLTQEGSSMIPQANVDMLDAARGWQISEMSTLLRTIRQWAPDMVHIHYPSQGFYGRALAVFLPLACRALGLTVVQTWHEPWPLRSAIRFLLQRAGSHGLIFVRPNYVKLLPFLLRPIIRKLPQRIVISAGSLPVSIQTSSERHALRQRYLEGLNKLVVFFGFLYPSKGIEDIFDIADPATDALVIVGASKDSVYLRKLYQIAEDRGWKEQVHYLGFIPEADAANLLSAADAVVLPFAAGSGHWNTSVHGALTQGTLVITTATDPTGDDPVRNLYTAQIGGIEEMRSALRTLAGRRTAASPHLDAWARIAQDHHDFYHHVQHFK